MTEAAPNAPPWYRHRSVWIAVIVVLVLAIMFLLWSRRGQEQQAAAGPPPAVVTAERVRNATWSEQLTAVGSLRAVQGVDVTTEVAGVVKSIEFENGESAAKGETLVQLDVSSELAELRALEAQREQARLAFERASRLIQRGAIAEADLEEAKANFQNLSAQVAHTRTIIDKKHIRAPFAGELGIRQINLGQFLSPGTAIVSLQQVAPIYVDFDLPEATVARVTPGQKVSLRIEAYGGRTFAGTINAIDPDIDPNTRSIAVQAQIENEDRALRPGMFADVTVTLPGTREVTVVPASAITRNAYGDAVYLVTRPAPNQQAEQPKQQQEKPSKGGQGGEGTQPPRYVAKTAFIKTGERRGQLVEILQGVQADQVVVTAGQIKLDDGTPVIISQRNAQRDVPERPLQP